MFSSTATVSLRSIRPLLSRLADVGCDVQPLLLEAGLVDLDLEDGDARVPHTRAVDLWKRAAQKTGDATIGLHAAETLRPGAFDILDYAIRSRPTLGEAWASLCRYHRLLHDAAVVELSIEGEFAHLSHALPAPLPPVPREIGDFLVASWLVTARQCVAIDFAPSTASFRHARPADVREYERVFRCELRFGDAANRLTIPRALLDTPLVKSDPGLCAVLERHVHEALARLPATTTFASRVRELVALALNGGDVAVDAVARKLHMSARTLHRRLAEEGNSYQAILESLRKDLAERHLAERGVGVAEVAFLLGFSEPSAFHRAFKRWTGVTPAEYRRSHA